MPANIARPLFDGRRAVRALWFDLALIGEAEARRRVLAQWQPGSRLFQLSDGYLLEWPQAAWRRVDEQGGLALCEIGHVLSSAPLTPAELRALPQGSYWLVRGAHAVAAVPQARIDPGLWLDLDAIPLREPLAYAVPAGPAEPASVKQIRDILGDAIPAASQSRDLFLKRSADALAKRGPAGESIAGLAGAVGLGVAGLLFSLVGSLLPGARAGSGGGNGAPELTPLAARLVKLTARLAVLTRMSKVMGWRQAMYMRRMLDLFDKGDLEEALRHAIPLGTIGKSAEVPMFGTPRPRNDLRIGGGGGVRSVIGLDTRLEEHLRATYRRTFEQLDRAGRIDEAVYVLAELLKCGTEAATYLEKKERYAQAAQLAETMELSSDIAVRLWVQAGDMERAVLLARLHNQFGDAVRMLESRQSPHASALRRHWAEYLAARGDLAEAIDAVWPCPEHHAFALACMVHAEQAGGTPGMRALARKLALMPGTLKASAPAIDALLGAVGEDAVQTRARLALELIAVSPSSASVRRVAGALARIVIAERAAGHSQIDKAALKKLVDLADAPMLRADLPTVAVPHVIGQALRSRDNVLALSLEERGLLTIHDARCLPDGQFLLALGESGMVRIGRLGKQIAHYPVPAYHLVLAGSGQRALALARRDGACRVSRLDLLTGKVADWLLLPLLAWSDHYDGVTWNVAMDKRLAAIDTTAPQLKVSWQVADLPGTMCGYADNGTFQALLLQTPEGVEQWSYSQPGRQLRQRDGWPMPEAGRLYPSTDMLGPRLLSILATADGKVMRAGRLSSPHSVDVPLGHADDDIRIEIAGDWLMLVLRDEAGARCLLADLQTGKVRAAVTLPEALDPRMLFQDPHVLIVDRAGRLVAVDCDTGQVRTHVLS